MYLNYWKPDKEEPMQAIEFETRIDKNGHIYLPEEYQHAYGKLVRLVVLTWIPTLVF